jgi:S1-C subfamily serine protease
MKLKHLFATLLVAVVALTTAGCADLVRVPPDPGLTSTTTRATGEPHTGTTGKGAGTTAGKATNRPMSQSDVVAMVKPSVVRLAGWTSGGSGVVVDDRRGLVLTNAHVTSGMDGMQARVGDDPASETAAQLVAAAPCADLAMVRLVSRPANLRAIRLGDSSRLRPGDPVIALGYPGSLEEGRSGERTGQAEQLVPTFGPVSVVHLTTAPSPDYPRLVSVIQHQATINPGNSGGPLVDKWGRLVGINTLRRADTEGQNYSISVEQIRGLLSDLEAGRSQANLGWDLVSLATADLPAIFDEDPAFASRGGAALGQRVADELGRQGIEGMYVRSAEPGSPAKAARIGHGNVVTSIAGEPVAGIQDVCRLLLAERPGQTIDVSGYWINGDAGTGADMEADVDADTAAGELLQPWTTEVVVG